MWISLAINALRMTSSSRKCLQPFGGIFEEDVVTPEVALHVASRANLWPYVVETVLKEPCPALGEALVNTEVSGHFEFSLVRSLLFEEFSPFLFY